MTRLSYPLFLCYLLLMVALVGIDWVVILALASKEWLGVGSAIALVVIPKLVGVFWLGARLLRLAEQHFAAHGNGGVKIALLGCLLGTVVILLVGAVESTQSILFAANVRARAAAVEPPRYAIVENRAAQEYLLSGLIDFGVSSDLRAFIKQHPGGKRVILASIGGAISEGRGLFVLFRDLRLDTHVVDECSSACALAFLGGQRRTIAAAGLLGFHQYALEANPYQVLPFYSLQSEQAHDGKLMLQSGVTADFVARVFDRPHTEIWYPTHASLLRAGVVDAIE